MNFLRNRTANLRARVAETTAPATIEKETDDNTDPSNSGDNDNDPSQSSTGDGDYPTTSGQQQDVVDASDRTDDDVASMVASVFSSSNRDHDDEVLSDPEVIHLNREIKYARLELKQLKQAGTKTTRRRTNQELKQLQKEKNSKARALWMKEQSFKHNFLRGHLDVYKTALIQCSLPSHDTTPATLNNEAKLLRVQHNSWMTDRQMQIVQTMQQQMIDYLYNVVKADIKNEHELAAMVGQNQVDKATKSKYQLRDLYEECLGLQRKILAKYRLRDLEQQRSNASYSNLDLSISQSESTDSAGNDMQSPSSGSNISDSVRARMEEAQNRKTNRKKKMRELHKNVDDIVKQEKDAIDRVNKHTLTLSDHSVDLLNEDLNGDHSSSSGDSDDEFGNDNGDGVPSLSSLPTIPGSPNKSSKHGNGGDGDDEAADDDKATSSSGNESLTRLRALRAKAAASASSDDDDSNTNSASGERKKLRGKKRDIVGSSDNNSNSGSQDSSSKENAADNTEEGKDGDESKPRTSSRAGAGRGGLSRTGTTGISSRRLSSGSGRGGGGLNRTGISSRRLSSGGGRGGGARTDLLERARSARKLNSSLNTGSDHVSATRTRVTRPGLGTRAASSRDFTSSSRKTSVTNPDERKARLDRLRNKAAAPENDNPIASPRARGKGGGLSASRREALRKKGEAKEDD